MKQLKMRKIPPKLLYNATRLTFGIVLMIGVLGVGVRSYGQTPPLTPTGTVTTAPAPFLGLRTQIVAGGIEVREIVTDSPAERAGFRIGDRITALNGTPIPPDTALSVALSRFVVGETVLFSVSRNGIALSIGVTLAPGSPTAVPTSSPTPPNNGSVILPGDAYLGFGVVDTGSGLRIEQVIGGSPAARAGLLKDDILSALDGIAVTSSGAVRSFLSGKSPGMVVKVTVIRAGQTLTFTITLGSASAAVATPAPSASATPILPTAVADAAGRVSLGLTYETVTSPVTGARVITLNAGGIAERAGIRVGDVITAVEGDAVDAKRTLALRMLPYVAGDTVILSVTRGDERLKITVTLAVRESA